MRAHTSVPNLSRFPMQRDLALLVLVVIGSSLPFLAQPFHMDDNFYMDMARNARVHVWFPNDIAYDFGGYHASDMASHSHPPLQTYFLAAVQAMAGEGSGSEWIYHTLALIFPLMAVIAFYFLAARFIERPIWPALALAVCPLFMVMAHTLMTDVPTLAYWLAAIACFLWATDLGSKWRLAASAVFLFAAMFCSYQAVAIVPLLGFYQIRRRGKLRGWIALILPVLAMAGWLTATSMHYGRMILGRTVDFVNSYHPDSPSVIFTKALAVFEYQGWLLVFPLFLAYAYGRALKARSFMLAMLAAAYVTQMQLSSYRLIDRCIFAAGLTVGILLVCRMLGFTIHAFRRREDDVMGMERVHAQFVALWYLGVLFCCLVVFNGGSARYLLPLVPPFLIVYFRGLEIREASEYRETRPPWMNSAMVASGSVVLSMILGLFLSQADFELASVYPRVASAFSRLSSGLESYVTGEWGFRYYMTRKGARPLPADETTVSGGSLLIKPQLPAPFDPPSDLASMTIPFARFTYDVKTPFRIMDVKVPAGFYSTGWGMVPFSLSSDSIESMDIRQVSFMVERLPWAQIESQSGIQPWPGLAAIGKENILSLLAKPGTKIAYAWPFRQSMRLKLQVGLQPGSAPAGAHFGFSVAQSDEEGRIRVRQEHAMDAGMPWQSMELVLQPGGALLCGFSGNAEATGAFAGALVIPDSLQGRP